MVIIEDNEKIRKEKIARMKELLADVKLPKRYRFEGDVIRYGNENNIFDLTSRSIALLYLKDDVIEVSFHYEKDYNDLKSCFENSKTKFELSVEGGYY